MRGQGRGHPARERAGRGERERGNCRHRTYTLGYQLAITGQEEERASFRTKNVLIVAFSRPCFCLSHIPHLSSPPPVVFKYSPFSKWPLLKRRCTYPQPQGVGIDLSKTSLWLHFLPSGRIRHEHMAKFSAKGSKGVETAQMFVS